MASHAARRFARRGEPSDDLFQVACLGLVKAARRFDPDRGVRFATFAMPTVVGEIRRHFRDRTWGLRVSRGLKDLHLELRTATELGVSQVHVSRILRSALERLRDALDDPSASHAW